MSLIDIVELVGIGAVVGIVGKQTCCINTGYVGLKYKVILTERFSLPNASKYLKVAVNSDLTGGLLN